MGKFALGWKSVSILLTVLLAFHSFHVYTAWKQSKNQIVEAIYKIPPALYVAQPGAEKKLEEALTARLKLDNQFSDDYRPSIWDNKGEIHASFAARLPDPVPALDHFGEDLSLLYRVGLAPAGAMPATSPAAANTAVRLLSWNSRPTPGPKPLDWLSLAVLIGALLAWFKGDQKSLPARTTD